MLEQISFDSKVIRQQQLKSKMNYTIIIKNAGMQLKVGSVNPAIKDRIAALNSVLKVDNCRLTIDPKCVKVINGLRKHTYKEGTRLPEKDGVSDYSHFNDAIGYMVNHLYPVRPYMKQNFNKQYRSA